MSRLAPYIPAKEATFDAWANNFATLVAAGPATYGLVASDAVAITAAYTLWHAAYLILASPSTKTKTAVQAKNAAKVSALAVLRPYSQQIARNAGVTTDEKISLGLNPQTSTPTPVPAPSTFPVLSIKANLPAETFFNSKDSAVGGNSKAKPAGSVALQVFATVSSIAITDPNALSYAGTATTSPFSLNWPVGSIGKIAYVAARWITQKGKVGPFSSILLVACT